MMSYRTALQPRSQTTQNDRPLSINPPPANGVLDVQQRRRFAQRLAVLIERIRVPKNLERGDEH